MHAQTSYTSLPTELTSTITSPSSSLCPTVVFNSELGVQWNTSAYTGGSPITKFLVEWDILSSFPRSNITQLHVVVNASAVARTYGPINQVYYAYQITSLSNLNRAYVRVSAFNGVYGSALGGYSPATTGTPLGSTIPCNLFPYHCSSLPKDQLLYKPVAPTVSLNAQQVGKALGVRRYTLLRRAYCTSLRFLNTHLSSSSTHPTPPLSPLPPDFPLPGGESSGRDLDAAH